MSDHLKDSIRQWFEELPDPRVTGRCDHNLIDIIIIAICGVISGADSWVGIETYGKAKEMWLTEYLSLVNGIPSHDTFGDVFSQLDSEAFQAGFSRWVESIFTVTSGQVVAIDGKTARRSHAKSIGKDAIHMVSAWAGIVLGQRKVDDKSNEITAIPELAGDREGIKEAIHDNWMEPEAARAKIDAMRLMSSLGEDYNG